MTTSRVSMTTDRPADAPSTYADAVGTELAAKTARRSIADTIKAAPRKARAFIASTARTLHLDGALSVAGDAARWIVERMRPAFRIVRGLGVINILGVVLTTPLRRTAVKVLAKAYRVASTPLRWIGRGLAWGLNKFALGRKVVAKTTEYVAKAEAFVAHKVEQGVQWLEKNDEHGATRWLRWYFQATVVRKGLRMAFPRVPGWTVYAAGLAVPVYGDKIAAEEEAIERAHAVLDAQAPAAKHQMRPVVFVLTDSDLPADAPTFEAPGFVDEQGEKYVRLGKSGLTHSEDLESSISIVGEVTGEVLVPHPAVVVDVEKTVRQAQASSGGRPPALPSTAPRAARRASGKKPARAR